VVTVPLPSVTTSELLKVKFASPFNVVPPSLVNTRLAEALFIVTCDGNEVKFAPLPLNEVAVKTPEITCGPPTT